MPEEKNKDMKKETTGQEEEYEYRHRTRPILMVLIIIIGLMLLFGAFMVGGSFRHSTAYYRIGGISDLNDIGRGMSGYNRLGGFGKHGMAGTRTLGSITAISGNTVTVHGSSQNYSVTVSSSTAFYKNGAVDKQSDLQVGDIVTITGTPDSSGNIQASAISIF